MHIAQYKDLFLREAESKLKRIEDRLVAIEQGQAKTSTLETLLTEVHSLKSDAATMNFVRFANALHQLEEYVLGFERDSRALPPAAIDHVFIGIDALRADLESIRATDTEIDLAPAFLFTNRLVEGNEPRKSRAGDTAGGTYEPLGSYLDVPASSMDDLLHEVNDIVANSQSMVRALKANDWGALTIAVHSQAAALSAARQRLIDMKLMPVRQYFGFLARLVRDTARGRQAFVSLSFNHNNLRLERRVLESLRDAVIQLVKNAVEHGFAKGDKGSLAVSFSFQGSNLVVTVKDSGRGIDFGSLEKRAVAEKAITASALKRLQKTRRERTILSLGVSTRPKATIEAGHGIGWRSVLAAMATLGGVWDVASHIRGAKHGTAVTLLIPLPPSMFRAISWRWGSFHVAVPFFALETVVQLPRTADQPIGKWFVYRSKKIPVVSASTLYGEALGAGVRPAAVAVIRDGDLRAAIPIPGRVIEQELVMETHDILASVPLASGFSVADTGSPIIILNAHTLLNLHG